MNCLNWHGTEPRPELRKYREKDGNNTFSQQEHVKLLKSDSEEMYYVTEELYLK